MSEQESSLRQAVDAVALKTSPVFEPQRRPARELPDRAKIDRPIDPGSVGTAGIGRTFGRAMDVVISSLALACFFAILPLIALAIRIDSRGPIFYSQVRIGQNRRRARRDYHRGGNRRKVLQPGRPFRILKLRSMVTGAEANGPQWAEKNDSRVTRVGRILRKTRLDEVPQFLNVLRGEMSLIGPRPERLCFIRKLEQSVPFYLDRLLVPPGITGLAQVVNGYDDSEDSVKRKVSLDRSYIRQRGLRVNLRILVHTVRVVVTGEGAC